MRYPGFMILASVLLLRAVAPAAPVHELLGGFSIGPRYPDRAALYRHSDGNFYGTTPSGGAYNLGAIFCVTPVGVVSLVASFSGTSGSAKGSLPYGGLVADAVGNLWGTTLAGGHDDFGTVFKLNPTTGALTTIVEFTDVAGAAPGNGPNAGLAADAQGAFWGTTTGGGANSLGNIFKVNASTGAFESVVEFTGTDAVPGFLPVAELVNDGSGSMWGTTAYGGDAFAGTVFKVDIATGAFTNVSSFPEFTDPPAGAYPFAELTNDGAGFLWGTTMNAYPGSAGGTIFKINRATGVRTTVQVFDQRLSAVHGITLANGLANDGAGFMWGATGEGGANGNGTIFKVNIASGALTTVYHAPADSPIAIRTPSCTLVPDGAGSLWGMANGGRGFLGVVLKMDIESGLVTTVAGFNVIAGLSKGENPNSGLVGDGAGYLWGTTTSGGEFARGTIFKINERSGALTTVVEFRDEPGGAQGSFPYAALAPDGAEFLWGSTSSGGANGLGTLFKININTGMLTTVINFTANGATAKGSAPIATLVRDSAGQFWGSTRDGGASGAGTIFKLNPITAALATVVQFTGVAGTAKGSRPHASLVSDGSGFFWGTTRTGGSGNLGTVFKFNASTGALTTFVQFTGPGGASPGNVPLGALVSDGAGSFWGTTSAEISGQVTYLGTIFKINATTGAMTTLAYFNGFTPPNVGRSPWAGLLNDGMGKLWGTSHGGNFAPSTVFNISLSGVFSHVLTFTDVEGDAPGRFPGYGTLLRHTDGNFYGTTAGGGPGGGGTIFRLRFGPTPTTLPATGVRSSTALLNATVNPNGAAATAVFEWGLAPGALTNTSIPLSVPAGAVPVAINAEAANLLPGTTYYFRVRAENGGQFVPQVGDVLSFTTNSPPTGGNLTLTPASPVAPLAMMSATATGWVDANAPLTYQFFIDGASLGLPTTSATADFAAPALVGDHVVAVHVFDALGDFTEATRSFTVNHAPIVRSTTLGAVSGSATSIAVAKLITFASDADGDVIVLIGVSSVSAHGGVVSLANGLVTYTSPTGYTGEDSFTYTVRDARGSITIGTVNVLVSSASAPSLNLVSITQTPEGFLLRFAGVPGVAYLIQFRNALDDPWQTLNPPGQINAGPNGLFEFEDRPNPRPPTRFYRAVQPP